MVALDNISVVLVRPIQGGNVGSVARAMKNLEFHRLKMVRPRARINLQCRKMAGQAIELVETASIFESFEAATADENVLVGTTSSRGREEEPNLLTPRQIAPKLAAFAGHQKIGLVFGPERSGLSREELDQCQHRVSIPGNPQSPVLNLAQAVLVLLYEIRSALPSAHLSIRELAAQREREDLFAHMESVLIRIGFLSSGSPAPVMRQLRSMLGRAELGPSEVLIWRGILSQMDWYVREGFKLGPDGVKKP